MQAASRRRGRRAGIIALLVLAIAIVVVETHHGIVAFRTWTFALLFLLLAAAAVVAAGRLRDGFVVLAALAFGLFAVELTADALEPKNPLTITQGWAKYDRTEGWALARPGVIEAQRLDPKTGKLAYKARYTIDANDNRLTTATGDGPGVIFFGGSFTFGDGLNDDSTMPQHFADLFTGRQRTVNLGVTGYGPQQFLRAMETGYKADVIGVKPAAFVFLTVPFHAARTACKEPWTSNAPLYALVQDKVTFVGACYNGLAGIAHEWIANCAAYRVFLRPLQSRLTHDDITLYIRIVAQATKAARQRYGVETLVPFLDAVPHYLDGTGYDNATILRELQSQGVAAVDMTLADRPSEGVYASIPGDGHPTGYANLTRAPMIRDALAKLGVTFTGEAALR